MKNYLIRNWYFISVFVAGLIGLALGLGDWDASQSMILVSMLFIFLHFFEEFGFPGGFAGMAVKAELKLDIDDPQKFPLNHANAWFGNWWYAFSVYFLALFFPNLRFMTLAVALFAFAEFAMHGLFFPIATKKIYNAGLITTLIGLVPASLIFLFGHISDFTGLDYLFAILWIAVNYWFAFRSPIYKGMEKYSQTYALTNEEAFGRK